MALLKPIPTSHGIDATYHRVEKIEISASRGSVEVVVAVYASPEARQAGGTPIWHVQVAARLEDFEDDLRDFGYSVLKAIDDPRFADAQDDGGPSAWTVRRVQPPAGPDAAA